MNPKEQKVEDILNMTVKEFVESEYEAMTKELGTMWSKADLRRAGKLIFLAAFNEARDDLKWAFSAWCLKQNLWNPIFALNQYEKSDYMEAE